MDYKDDSIHENKKLRVGDIFTPLLWGGFAATTFGIYKKWLNGASVFDPTMGEGNLLESLVSCGLSEGIALKKLPINRLYGNEINEDYYQLALKKFRDLYQEDMSGNFSNADILQLDETQYDILFGNPPWQNFVDLPDSYKEQVKSHFVKYGLVENGKSVLLGGSRIDIAALIVKRVLKDFLKKGGEAVFFLPLSLLLNDGANKQFRTYSIEGTLFSIEKIYDFHDEPVFEGVSTRYGLVHFCRDKTATFPVPFLRKEKGQWVEYFAKPLFQGNDPLSVVKESELAAFRSFVPVSIKKESVPRQGINTCGANDVFFFHSFEEIDEDFVAVSNKVVKKVKLPRKFVFPLISSKDFKPGQGGASRWVLLPYHESGKALNPEELKNFPEMEKYLSDSKERLVGRKGRLLRSMLEKGIWWQLMGVGPYNFYPYKIVWEAYGRHHFQPKIFDGYWQANQALQAFIPLRSKEEADRVFHELQDSRIERYLLSLKMAGTMNWAQPGKIKKLISYL
jgi:hypothetical protein